MSWDSNRTSEPLKSKEEIVYHLRQVNATLEQMAFDSSLTDDFKDPQVARAIKHWTNEKRLSPDEAAHFQDNYRVVSVLQKINQLQNCCRQMGITIPLELFLNRKPELGIDFLSKSFGTEVGVAMYHAVSEQQSSSTLSSSSSSTTKTEFEQVQVSSPKGSAKSTLKSTEGGGGGNESKQRNNNISEVAEEEKASSTPPAIQQKRVYGPSNEDEDPADSVTTNSEEDVGCGDGGGSGGSSIFWSTRCTLNDPKFSSKTFLLYTLGELLIIVMVGFFIAYFLKILKVLV